MGYAGVVEAVFIDEDHQDRQDHHNVPHTGISKFDPSLLLICLGEVGTEHKSSLDHFGK